MHLLQAPSLAKDLHSADAILLVWYYLALFEPSSAEMRKVPQLPSPQDQSLILCRALFSPILSPSHHDI